MSEIGQQLFTRRQYLTINLLMHGMSALFVEEAISSTALAHPEWDLDEEKTWDEWNEDR